MRERHADDGRAELITEGIAEEGTVGDGERSVGESVVGACEAEDPGSAGGEARRLESGLYRLRA